MKLLHISDLHLGRRLDGVSFIDDQTYIFNQIYEVAQKYSIDAILIAGDVYDRSIPTVEATRLLNDTLELFTRLDVPIYIVAGNHDSIDRLSFGREFFKKSRIYISSRYTGTIQQETLSDEFGELNIYLMPYVSIGDIRYMHNDIEINNLADAFKVAISSSNVDTSKRNILVAHQYVMDSNKDDSEFRDYLGGTQCIDSSVFLDTFDYTALGHIHRPYWVVKDRIRYCGSPIKYSINEYMNHNSVTIVNFREKGNIIFEEIALNPLRNIRKLRGSIQDIVQNATNTDDYVDITLTDEEYITNAINKVRSVYPNTLKLSFDNSRTRIVTTSSTSTRNVGKQSMVDLFTDFLKDAYDINLQDFPNYSDILKDAIKISEMGDKERETY